MCEFVCVLCIRYNYYVPSTGGAIKPIFHFVLFFGRSFVGAALIRHVGGFFPLLFLSKTICPKKKRCIALKSKVCIEYYFGSVGRTFLLFRPSIVVHLQ